MLWNIIENKDLLGTFFCLGSGRIELRRWVFTRITCVSFRYRISKNQYQINVHNAYTARAIIENQQQ